MGDREVEQELRQVVMRRAADQRTASGPASPAPRGGPLIQQVGPDFTRLSRELNRVVLKIQHQAEVASDCQVHGDQYTESPRRGSRGPEREGSRPASRGSMADVCQPTAPPRSASAEAGRAGRGAEPSYQSLPRRLSRLPPDVRGSQGRVDRRQSFQDFKAFRDKFTGKLDFKTTLRTSEKNPDELPKSERDWIKKNEQDKRREARARVRGREYSEPREQGGPEVIESDFDFRSPPGTRDASREGRGEEERQPPRRGDTNVYSTPGGARLLQRPQGSPRYQYGYQDLKYGSRDELRSPGRVWSPEEPPGRAGDPLSPRRVGFSAANEVFSFTKLAGGEGSRPPSRSESPAPKSILRHTTSEPAGRLQGAGRSHTVELASPRPGLEVAAGRPAVRSNTTDLSFCSAPLAVRPTSLIIPGGAREPQAGLGRQDQPLVQIHLPPPEEAGGGGADSDDTLIEEKHEVEESEKRLRSAEVEARRRVPPALADWNRSQSFPPAATTGLHPEPGGTLGDLADLDRSNSSLLSQPLGSHHSDIDLLRGDNQAMRLRVGDLEKQVHDNNDDIKCLKATLAECLRRIDLVERQGEVAPAPAPRARPRANVIEAVKVPRRSVAPDYGNLGQVRGFGQVLRTRQ